jgi:putative lipoic acid-binding regulatory protein
MDTQNVEILENNFPEARAPAGGSSRGRWLTVEIRTPVNKNDISDTVHEMVRDGGE